MKKNSFQFALMLLAFVMVFASCNKDEEVELKSEANYDGATIALKKGFHEGRNGWYDNIFIASEDITNNDESYSYSAECDGLRLYFYNEGTVVFDGTYQLTNEFEVNNSFTSANIILNGENVSTTEEDTGSVIIKKEGDIYEITCNFTINGKELKAYFKGTLTFADRWMPGK